MPQLKDPDGLYYDMLQIRNYWNALYPSGVALQPVDVFMNAQQTLHSYTIDNATIQSPLEVVPDAYDLNLPTVPVGLVMWVYLEVANPYSMPMLLALSETGMSGVGSQKRRSTAINSLNAARFDHRKLDMAPHWTSRVDSSALYEEPADVTAHTQQSYQQQSYQQQSYQQQSYQHQSHEQQQSDINAFRATRRRIRPPAVSAADANIPRLVTGAVVYTATEEQAGISLSALSKASVAAARTGDPSPPASGTAPRAGQKHNQGVIKPSNSIKANSGGIATGQLGDGGGSFGCDEAGEYPFIYYSPSMRQLDAVVQPHSVGRFGPLLYVPCTQLAAAAGSAAVPVQTHSTQQSFYLYNNFTGVNRIDLHAATGVPLLLVENVTSPATPATPMHEPPQPFSSFSCDH